MTNQAGSRQLNLLLLTMVSLAFAACSQADAPPFPVTTPNIFFGNAPAPNDCEGEVACACLQDSDCDSGACVESVGGKLCAGPCGDACQGGTVCVQLSVGGAKSSFCVDPNARLCQPCVTDVDCQAAGLFGAACVSHGPRGRFCGVACTPGGGACPDGFVCEAVQAASGTSTPQCVPVGGEGDLPGVCPCSPAAVAAKAVTPCPSQGGDACSWYAACEAPGQAPVCKPLGAGEEVCDQLDNDCDGQTDEDTCADGGPCNPGGCSGGVCKYLAKPDGALCGGVDGDPCSVAGVCKAGQCEGAKTNKCDDGRICTTDACDGKGDCLHTPVAAGTPCDDGNACTSQDGCDGETCGGGAPVACDDGDPCTDDSCAPASGCVTNFNAAPCSDANSCKAGQCSQGKCVLSDAEGCDDNNPCTHDACEGGKCTNANKPGQPCDDGDACTEADACDPDVAGCKGGALVKCDDGNPCTTDSCDAVKGCQVVNVKDETGCSQDGSKWCQAGKCVNAGKSSWIALKPGSFTMGSPAGTCTFGGGKNTEQQHKVTLTNGFEILSTEVTQGQFFALMGYNPASFKACGAKCPVENISWYEAAAYCNALSKKAGLTPCYSCSGSGASVKCNEATGFAAGGIYNCSGYRLPTEAEFEYAYRAGTSTDLYNGPFGTCGESLTHVVPNLGQIGWYSANAGSKTHPIGLKAPNAWGLYDMAGNVYEMCNDIFSGAHPTTPITDPGGPLVGKTKYGNARSNRGGSWNYAGWFSRAGGFRGADAPENKWDHVGFRPVRTLPKKAAGVDCAAIKAKDKTAKDGVYTIDPDGAGGKLPYDVHCDMTHDGGGWTLVAVSSDDGQNTWTWNNRHYWDTDTKTFGSLNALNKDFKSAALHEVMANDLLFVHAPSGVWASYGGVQASKKSFAQLIAETGENVCSDVNKSGYKMTAGTLATKAGAKLCSTKLFFNQKDQGGTYPCPKTGTDHSYGPTWSATFNYSNGCPLDDPGYSGSLGPWHDFDIKLASQEYWSGAPAAVGFGAALGLNSGGSGSGANNMRVYVRRAICGNGQIEGKEQCDDGNAKSGDGCSATCESECSTCGDGCCGPSESYQNCPKDCPCAGGTKVMSAAYWCNDTGNAFEPQSPLTAKCVNGQATLPAPNATYYAGLSCPFDVSVAHTGAWPNNCGGCLDGVVITNGGGNQTAVWRHSKTEYFCCAGKDVVKINK